MSHEYKDLMLGVLEAVECILAKLPCEILHFYGLVGRRNMRTL